MKRLIHLFLCGFIVGSLTACGDDVIHPQTLILNREGNKALQAQNAQESSEKYLGALRYNPYLAELHLNLGLSFEFLQLPEKALQSYKYADQLAEKIGNAEASFTARFNAGQLLGKSKKVDEAIEFYQKALDILPTSKETKHNIELLTQMQGKGQGGQGSDDQQEQDKGKEQENKDGKGQGKDQDKKDPQDPDDKKDEKKDDKEKDKPDDKPKEDKKVQGSPKYQPRPFNGKELDEGDVKKILGEIKQQEQRIRADFNRKETKEQPRDKDW